MTFRIEVTARARDDADTIHAWMAENISPAHAEKWYRELFERIETLIQHPSRCPIAPESRKLPAEIRELTHGKQRHKHKYRILFAIQGDVVSILSVYHSSRADFEP
jgi:plasmid stabilization system protein ParE